jgi:hypothetical protein
MKKIITALTAGAAVALALAACGSSAPAALTSHGTVIVFASPFGGSTLQNAYPDVASGGQVTVTDSSGTVIGTGTLTYNPGQTTATLVTATAGSGLTASELTAFVAEYDFTVTVPGGLARYGIKVGQNRGTIYETAAQMKDPSLTLGSLSG